MSVALHSENIEMKENDVYEVYDNVDNPPPQQQGDAVYDNDPPAQKQWPHTVPQLVTPDSRKCNSKLPVFAVGLLGLLLLAGITIGVPMSVKVSCTEMEEALLAQLSRLEVRLNTTEMRLNSTERDNAGSSTTDQKSTADTCVAVSPCDNAKNISSLGSTMDEKLSELQGVTNASLTRLQTAQAATDDSLTRLQTAQAATDDSLTRLQTAQAATDDSLTRLQTAQAATDDSLTRLQTAQAATDDSLTRLQTAQAATDDSLTRLQTAQAATDASLTRLQAAQDSLTRQNADLTSQLTTFNRDLGNLQRDVGPKVAFSASLADQGTTVYIGPAASQTIVFKRVVFNNGNVYNRHTGYFTAPQKGAYLFTFSTWGSNYYESGTQLVKNGQLQVSTIRYKEDRGTTSGAVILSLDARDTVNVITWGSTDSSHQIVDNGYHYTTFSGVLLFPL